MRLQNACVELHFNMPRATVCGLCANGVSLSLCLTPNSVLFDPMCTKLPLGCLAAQGKLSHFMPAAASSVVQLFRGLAEKSFRFIKNDVDYVDYQENVKHQSKISDATDCCVSSGVARL